VWRPTQILKMTEVDELDGCAQEWSQGRGLWGGPATEIPRSWGVQRWRSWMAVPENGVGAAACEVGQLYRYRDPLRRTERERRGQKEELDS